MEEKFKYLEVQTTSDLDVVDMCLVSELMIPRKFKVPDFDKYKGINCLRNHLRAYCRKMVAHINDDQLLIHYFQDSLNGGILGVVYVIGKSTILVMERPRRSLSQELSVQHRLGAQPHSSARHDSA